MRVLVFQHADVEHPGIFRDFLAEDGIAWDAVELDAGEAIPSLEGYDQLWVMGGPMDAWQEAQHPWLVAEKQAIREAVELRAMPVSRRLPGPSASRVRPSAGGSARRPRRRSASSTSS